MQEELCFSLGKPEKQDKLKQFIFSFGIHPQIPVITRLNTNAINFVEQIANIKANAKIDCLHNAPPSKFKTCGGSNEWSINSCEQINEADFLLRLILEKKISAIGECGFDLFTPEYKRTLPEQKTVWNIQIDFAVQYGLPIVIHCRKALDLIFADTGRLKKLPSVIFHGWAGSAREAESFLKKGVNAFFCIGKGLLRGQKAQKETAAVLDISRLLTETDAPYMTLKGEPFSLQNDVKKVAAALALTRGISAENLDEFIATIERNFNTAFLLH